MKTRIRRLSTRLMPWLPWPAALEPLARRITILMAMMIVSMIAGMLWLSHARVVDAVSDSELTRLGASANQLSNTLRSQARRLLQDGARVAAMPAIREAAATPRVGSASIDALLAAERAAASQILSIAIWDAAGRLVAAAGTDAGERRPDSGMKLETATSPTVSALSPRGDSVLYSVTAPIAGVAGLPAGYVVITRQITGGREQAALMSGLVGRNARVLLGNADGDFFTDFTRRVAMPDLPDEGKPGRFRDASGEEMFGAAALVPETPWLVIVEAPRTAALLAASKFTIDSALFGAGFVVVAALLSWLLIRRTMTPLEEVTTAARDIAAGDLTRRVSVSGRDEIAILAEAFNQMVERVEESSAELASRATQLERINKNLNESEARYRSLFEHLPDAILVHRNQRIVLANPSALRLLGAKSEADLADKPVLEYVFSSDRPLVSERIRSIVADSGVMPTVEVRLQRLDRKIATAEATSMPLRIDGLPAVQTVLHDVTERRQLEEQLRQSQKMDAVGRLAGGVAHDFNNLLTVIQAHAEFALAENESEETRRADIQEIRKTADNAARLTRQLLTFSRKQALTPAEIDLNEAIAGMLGMVQRLIGDNIEVVRVAGRDLKAIWADPGQIQQVLLNLAVNARDAMPDGGVLRFETANISIGEGYVGGASSTIPPGDYVMLAVQDTGVGMTEEIRTRVFEPFFTTKQVGRGTGLGLSTVYGIVKQSEGHIWVYSEPGMGTAFKVLFPPYEGETTAATADSNGQPAASAESGHLLVVEDDESVRTAVVRALRGVGFTVTEAANAAAAQACIERDPSIELLITDMVMPGKPGMVLLNEVRALRPGLPAIVLSGYSEQAGSEVWRVPAHAVFVEKPVSPADLIRQVKQLLSRG